MVPCLVCQLLYLKFWIMTTSGLNNMEDVSGKRKIPPPLYTGEGNMDPTAISVVSWSKNLHKFLRTSSTLSRTLHT